MPVGAYWAFDTDVSRRPSRRLLGVGGPNEDRPDPPPANQMINWLFKYYVTALPGGSAPPP